MTDQATTTQPTAQPSPSNGANPPRASLDNFHALIEHNMRAPAAAPAAPAAPAAVPAIGRRDAPANDNSAPNTPAVAPTDALPDEPEPDAEQQAEAIADLLEQDYHGRKGREILEAIGKGELPAELLAAIKGVAKVNGQDMPVSFREALDGYQRQADYTRGKQELKQMQQQARGQLDSVQQLFDGWKSGDQLLRDIKRLDKMPAFREAALAYATQEVQNQRWQRENPEAFRLHQQLQQERDARETLERDARNRPDPRAEQQRQQQVAQLEKLVGPAFEKFGLKDSPHVREYFATAFRALYEDGEDLGSVVQRAAESTAQLLGDLAIRHQQQQGTPAAPAKNPSPLPGRTAAPSTTGKPAIHHKSFNPADMDAYLREQRRGRR